MTVADKRTYEQRKEYYRQWRERNPEKVKAANDKDYQRHKEKRLAKHREWRETNPEAYCLSTEARRKRVGYDWDRYQRAINRLIRYDVPINQFEQLLKQFDEGPCDICGYSDESMEIDHDHKSEKFRGMLCHHCNKMLGHAKDNFDTLIRAAEYINARS